MTTQLDCLALEVPAYSCGTAAGARKDSTSRDGAAHANRTLPNRHAQVFALVSRHEGATCGEIASRLQLGMHCVSGRLDELAKQGRIVKTTDRRPSPLSKKDGFVWVRSESAKVAA